MIDANMIPLRLSIREQEDLRAAQRALLSPLVSQSFRDWQLRSNHAVRRYLGADRSVFVFPPSDEAQAPITTDDTDPAFEASLIALAADEETRARYEDPFLERVHRRRLSVGPGAYHLEEVTERTERSAAASFQEIFVPHGFEHLVALSAQAETGAVTQFFGFGRGDAPGYGERGLQKLRLLVPAFAAGVRTYRRWVDQRERFVSFLGDLGRPVALYDPEGRRLHRSPALEELLGAEPHAGRLEAAMDDVAGLLGGLGGGSGTQQSRVQRSFEPEVSGKQSRYRLSATYGIGGTPAEEWILVHVDVEQPLQRRIVSGGHRLTPRESEVAGLLAEGLSDKAIAQRLDISWHTVRTHVRNILGKLEISSRRNVGAELRRGVRGMGRKRPP